MSEFEKEKKELIDYLYDEGFEVLDSDLIMLYKFFEKYFTHKNYINEKVPDEDAIKHFIKFHYFATKDPSIDERRINLLKHFIKNNWNLETINKHMDIVGLRDFVTNVY